jgi:hypothetical protein
VAEVSRPLLVSCGAVSCSLSADRGERLGRFKSDKRSFEVLKLDTLATEHQASTIDGLPIFARWQDPQWKRVSVSLR